MAAVSRKMEGIARVSDITEQSARYDALIDELFSSLSEETLKAFIDGICAEDVPKQVSKSALTSFIKALQNLSGEIYTELVNHLLTTLKRTNSGFHDLDYQLREDLFKVLVKSQSYSEAARVLAAVNVDSSSFVLPDKDKADLYVRCAETFLLDDEAIEAETFVTKASFLINGVGDKVLLLRYRVIYARVLDANRKFMDAALRYYELSVSTGNIVKADLLNLYAKAIVCAILSKTSPQRKRLLALLFKDERLCDVETLGGGGSCVINMLSKTYKEQIISQAEVTTFSETLDSHQKAITAEGITIPQKSAIEHNIYAIGKVYENISIAQLASILSLEDTKAEKFAAAMISEGRLKASLDQADGLLVFHPDSSDAEDITGTVFNQLMDVVAIIQEKYPAVYAAAEGRTD